MSLPYVAAGMIPTWDRLADLSFGYRLRINFSRIVKAPILLLETGLQKLRETNA